MEGTHLKKNTLPAPKDLHFGLDFVSNTMSPKISKGEIYSPVTDLAMNLGELTTFGYGNTPKRRLSMSSIGTPTPTLKPMVLEKQLSFDPDSPVSFADSPFMQQRFGDLLQTPSDKSESPRSKMRSSALRRFQAMPVPFCGFEDASPVCHKTISYEDSTTCDHSPVREHIKFSLDDDENSQDSGVCEEQENLLPQPQFLEADFRFAEPCGRPPARRILRVLSDETNSPRRSWSALRQMSLPETDQDIKVHSLSPVKLQSSSLTHGTEDDEGDDGFLDLIDMDDAGITCSAPSGISGLFTAKMLTTERSTRGRRPSWACSEETSDDEDIENEQPQLSFSRRGLFRSPKVPRFLQEKSKSLCAPPRSLSFKRSEPCRDGDNTPVQSKRRKSIVDMTSPLVSSPKPASKSHTLHRCHSETEAMIKSALNRFDSQPDLIGDFSKPYCLELSHSKHQDLKGISPETMADVLRGNYDHIVERAIIIDARYPYEYEGGHIRGAQNIWTREDIMDTFVAEGKASQYQSKESHKRTIIIFHCEFSSERGPGLSRFLRSKDREGNTNCYPYLNYPELYLLEGGYKAFFHEFKELCDPEEYKEMLDGAHSDDLRHFRAKSKSWAGEKSGGRKGRVPFRPGLKSLSGKGLKL